MQNFSGLQIGNYCRYHGSIIEIVKIEGKHLLARDVKSREVFGVLQEGLGFVPVQESPQWFYQMGFQQGSELFEVGGQGRFLVKSYYQYIYPSDGGAPGSTKGQLSMIELYEAANGGHVVYETDGTALYFIHEVQNFFKSGFDISLAIDWEWLFEQLDAPFQASRLGQ